MFKLFQRQARRGPHSLNIILAPRGGDSKVYHVDVAVIRLGMMAFAILLVCCFIWIGFMTYRHISVQHEMAQLTQTKDQLARLQLEKQQQLEREAQTLDDFQMLDSRIEQLEAQLDRLAVRQGGNAVIASTHNQNGVGGSIDLESWQQDEQKADMLTAWRAQLDALGQRLKQVSAIPRGFPVDMQSAHLSSPFGYRANPFTHRGREFHNGLDFATDYGTDVMATADGRVVAAGWMGGLGMAVRIDHGYAYQTAFGHLSHISVEVGDRIKAGDVIGLVGSTGRSSGPHLHYIVYHHGQAIDPRPFI